MRLSEMKRHLRKTGFLLLYFLGVGVLNAFAGKPPSVASEVRFYYTPRYERKAQMYTYKNKTGDSNNDYLSVTISEQIARHLEKMGTIKILTNELSLTPVSVSDLYIQKPFTNTNASVIILTYEKEVVYTNGIIISETEGVVITNRERLSTNMSLEEVLENEDIYLETNIVLSTNYLYIDGTVLSVKTITNVNNDFQTNISSNLVLSTRLLFGTNFPVSAYVENGVTNLAYGYDGLEKEGALKIVIETNVSAMGVYEVKTNYVPIMGNVYHEESWLCMSVISNKRNFKQRRYFGSDYSYQTNYYYATNALISACGFYEVAIPKTNYANVTNADSTISTNALIVSIQSNILTRLANTELVLSKVFEAIDLLNTRGGYYISDFRFVRNDKYRITDGESADLVLSSNESLLPYEGKTVIVRDNSNFNRAIIMPDVFTGHPGESITNEMLYSEEDFVIFGDFSQNDSYDMTINSYIYRKKTGVLLRVYSTFAVDEIEDALPSYCYTVASRLNESEKARGISVFAEPSDALFYLDGTYMGRVSYGIYIPYVTMGEHRFSFLRDGYKPLEKDIYFNEATTNIRMSFNMEPIEERGILEFAVFPKSATVMIDGVKATDLEEGAFSNEILYGAHSLKITNRGYEPYQATFVISNTNTRFEPIFLERLPQETLARKVFLNYNRNKKVLLYSSASLGLATLGSFIWYTEAMDKTLVMMKHIGAYSNEMDAVSLYEMQYDAYKASLSMYWAQVAYRTTAISSAACAVGGFIYYLLWVRESDFPVENLSFNFSPTSYSFAFRYPFDTLYTKKEK